MRHVTITHTATFQLLAPVVGRPSTPVQARLSWSTRTPCEVAILFRVKNHPTWVLARQLLADGLTGRAGEGDVIIGPAWCRDVIELTLDAPSGYAKFLMERADVTRFLDATGKLIPAGAETLEITDRALRKLSAT